MRYLFVLLVAVIGHYLFMPTYAIDFFSGIVFVGFILSLGTVMAMGTNSKNQGMVLVSAGIMVGVFLLGTIVSTTAIIHSTKYRNLLGEVKTKDFKEALPPIDIKNAPLVSKHMANQAAMKKLSDIPALGSQVELSHFVKQNVRGKLYWVSFLEHSGFFQWFNIGHTIGYVMVSATNSEDVELVLQVKGQDLKMKYIDSAYYGDNAYRRIYSENKTKGITSLSAEIDDEGNPYVVASIYEHKVGSSGADTVGVSVLDVQTGEVKNYSLNEIPEWVDRVHSEQMIEEQVTDWGDYVNGWLNPSKKGKLTVSDHIDLVYGEDGNCYFYVGISSVGKDNGIIGFMMINSKTKENTLYYISGASEQVAAQSAEDAMPEKKYHATNPLPFMVNGVPTYIMTLTDQNGIPRAYGFVNIQHYQEWAVADSLKNTYQMYLNRLVSKSGVDIEENKELLEELSLVVDRIAAETKSGTTVYYLTLKGSTHIFTATSDLSEKLVLTQAGDSVKVTFEKSEHKLTTMSKFENDSIK